MSKKNEILPRDAFTTRCIQFEENIKYTTAES